MKNPTGPAALPPVTNDCVVPWIELIQRCGAPACLDAHPGTIPPAALQWATAHGVTIRTHWTGRPGLSAVDADRVRAAHEQAVANQNATNAAYREHVAEQKRQAAQARREAAARQEQQARELEDRTRERQAKRAAEEAAAAAGAAEGHGARDLAYEKFAATLTGDRR